MAWRGNTTPSDRLWASLAYLLPLTSALSLGIGLLETFPPLAVLFNPLFVFSNFVGQFGGYSSLVLFLVLYFLVVRNASVNHFIRFNTMQAILVDIARFLGVLLLGLLFSVFGELGLGLLIEVLRTTLFLAVVAITIFSWIQNVQGRYPELPVLSDAAYTQVRY